MHPRFHNIFYKSFFLQVAAGVFILGPVLYSGTDQSIYYKVWCLWTLECTNVTSPPVFKLWNTQGYLWLPYDLTEVIKLIGETFEPKNFFFQKITYVIPSELVSILP